MAGTKDHSSAFDSELSRKSWKNWYPHDPEFAVGGLYDEYVTAGESGFGFDRMVVELKKHPLLCLFVSMPSA